jgi:hypothetical protein
VRPMPWMYALLDSDLSGTTKLVGCAIANHINHTSGLAYPGRVKLARMSGKSTDTVDRAIAVLEELGCLHVTRYGGRGKTNEYALKKGRTHADLSTDVNSRTLAALSGEETAAEEGLNSRKSAEESAAPMRPEPLRTNHKNQRRGNFVYRKGPRPSPLPPRPT